MNSREILTHLVDGELRLGLDNLRQLGADVHRDQSEAVFEGVKLPKSGQQLTADPAQCVGGVAVVAGEVRQQGEQVEDEEGRGGRLGRLEFVYQFAGR